jgi:hypothetical protein
VARVVKWQRECGLDFDLTLHTQENSGERDKQCSLLLWNSRRGETLNRNLKLKIHAPTLVHRGRWQHRHVAWGGRTGAGRRKPGIPFQTASGPMSWSHQVASPGTTRARTEQAPRTSLGRGVGCAAPMPTGYGMKARSSGSGLCIGTSKYRDV